MTPATLPTPPRRKLSGARAAAVEKLRRVYLAVGWGRGDSERCSERDVRRGLYANVLGYRVPRETATGPTLFDG